MIHETRLYTIALSTLVTLSLLRDIFQPLWPSESNLYKLSYNCYSGHLLYMCDYLVTLSMPTMLTQSCYVKCCCTENFNISKMFHIFSPCSVTQCSLSFIACSLKRVLYKLSIKTPHSFLCFWHCLFTDSQNHENTSGILEK
jgi:hypothetical protein